jgi:hypothetical protein
MHLSRGLLALILLMLPPVLPAQSAAQDPPTAPVDAIAEATPTEAPNLALTKQRLAAVARTILNLQQQAEADPVVNSARLVYVSALRREMVRKAPELEDEIDRQAVLVEQLREHEADLVPAASESPEALQAQEERVAEYRALYEKLAPVERSVQTEPAVQQARSRYLEALIATMKRLNPATPELLGRHRDLRTRVRDLSDLTASSASSR